MTTDIYLDGEKLEFEDDGGNSTVKELIDVLEKELLDLRRCILELWVNGERLDEWRKSPILNTPISNYSDFRFTTASVEALALEGIDMVQEYIRVIKENISVCARELRLGKPSAEVLLTSVFEGLIEVLKTMDALIKGGGRYSIDLFRENPAAYYKPLLKHLDDLGSAKTSNDSILMADILEYELHSFISGMEEKIFHRYSA